MMHDSGNEEREIGNFQLRNTWQSRVNQYEVKEMCENERRQRSALPQLFDEWNQRWALRNATTLTAEKFGKGHEISEFRKVLELRCDEDENSKSTVIQPRPRPPPTVTKQLIPPLPQIPAPKKCDPQARKPSSKPRPQIQLEPPPKREEVKLRKTPKPETKRKEIVKTEREKVVLSSVVDKPSHVPTPQRPKKEEQKVQQKTPPRDWSHSWKYARSRPHHKIKRAKSHQDTQFASNWQTSVKHKEAVTYGEAPILSEWAESWKFLKNPFSRPIGSEELTFKKSLFFELEQETISPTEWADSWKILNLQLQQEHESWEQSWTQYCRHFQSNKLQNSCLDDDDGPSLFDWEESWKFLKPESKQEDENLADGLSDQSMAPQMMKRPKTDSWKLANAHNYEDTISLIEWMESWRLCSVQTKHIDSSDSYLSDVIYMPKSEKSSGMLSSQTLEEAQSLSEWSESWILPKSQENGYEGETEFNENTADPHLLVDPEKEISLSKWKESWKFSYANDEGITQAAWNDSWKLAFSKAHDDVMVSTEEDINIPSQIVQFQPSNNKCSVLEWSESSETLSETEWYESWKTVKPQGQQDSEPESVPKQYSYQLIASEKVCLSEWSGSWKLSVSEVPPHTQSPHPSAPSEWSNCWRLNSKPHRDQENQSVKVAFKNSSNRHYHMENPSISEWNDSWKSQKSSSPSSETSTENISGSEWGDSWKFVKPQCDLEGMSWSQQDELTISEDLQTKGALSIIYRGDRTSMCFDDEIQLCLTEWNESWKFLKPQLPEQQEVKSK